MPILTPPRPGMTVAGLKGRLFGRGSPPAGVLVVIVDIILREDGGGGGGGDVSGAVIMEVVTMPRLGVCRP